MPACLNCVAAGRVSDGSKVSPVTTTSSEGGKRKLLIPPSLGIKPGIKYYCPSGCGRLVAPRWRDKLCFTCFKKASPERAKMLEDRVAAKRAAMVEALRPDLELRRAEAKEMAELAQKAHKARVAWLSGDCWTRKGMVVDGRTPMQCCYGDCRASHAGNGFCRGHQPPANKLKGAVAAAKDVIRGRAGLPADQAG